MPKTSASKNTKKKETKNTIVQNSKVSFPILTKKKYIQAEELEPNQIYVISNFFNDKECDALIKYFEINLPPLPRPAGKPKKGEAFRNNDRQSIQNTSIASVLWENLEDIVRASPITADHNINGGTTIVASSKVPRGLNSNIRVYRYREGHSFGAHYDDSVQDKITGLWTDWTLLIYLNEDMEGGETVFYRLNKHQNCKSEPIVVRPKKGMALLHRHGTHCLLHEAKEVTKGNKWVLRSDLLMG
ncbi:hypothetical protein BDF20DRAFT_812342 [Mycotypha africana]|uniref:uncharacterized protein n=1 Tax=Mycotypha africana TaxID=64632 RepID=UPI0023014977|nr:uncharacterized protein BDF20DRAFT_812342 [Mycotypha africana]KAI8991812.1 hypothetical protein BDF20DRAFT_812342 [Mycotypha africana]